MSARHRQPTPPAPAATEPEAVDPDGTGPEPALSRRDRRAAARGGPAAKVLAPPPGRRIPVPNRQRDYASRRRG